MKIFNLLLFLTSILFGQTETENIELVDLRKMFGKYDGGFSIYNFKTDNYFKYNTNQCKKRFPPCSTFKIPNSIIGIETGTIPDTSFVIQYDSILHPKDDYMLANEPFKYWFQDLSLKSAFKYSCVWYYQELARRVGNENMVNYLKLFNYGNKDISDGIDKFWLCGSLQISIDEQVEFLKKFYENDLPEISEKTIKSVKDIMLYETTSEYKLYGKTGTGNCLKNKSIAWYIGIVETSTNSYVFALNYLMDNSENFDRKFRIELTKSILKKLKVIE